MSEIVLIRGLPGSGKTTLAKGRFRNNTLVEADMYRDTEEGYKYDRNFNSHAHEWAFYTVSYCLYRKIPVVVCSIFHRLDMMYKYFDLSEMHKVSIFVTEASYNSKSVHDVPEWEMTRLASEWEDLPESWEKYII